MSTIANNPVSSDLLTTMNPTKATTTDTAVEAQDRFMKLLVTQMKNQDPLNPLDNAQVTSQLAQLSTVTGIDKLNTTLQALQGSYQSSQTLAAAGMIGHGVFVPGSSIALQDSKAIFGIELSAGADKVEVSIKDASGKEVHKIDLGEQAAGTLPMAWDGTTDSGAAAPDGKYTFDVTATRGGEKVEVATGLSFGQVASVSTNAQGVKLNVPNLGAVSLADIREIL